MTGRDWESGKEVPVHFERIKASTFLFALHNTVMRPALVGKRLPVFAGVSVTFEVTGLGPYPAPVITYEFSCDGSGKLQHFPTAVPRFILSSIANALTRKRESRGPSPSAPPAADQTLPPPPFFPRAVGPPP